MLSWHACWIHAIPQCLMGLSRESYFNHFSLTANFRFSGVQHVLRISPPGVCSHPMPSRTSQVAQVGKRTLELSNLQKVLYPDEHIVKAELIEYYLKIAPTILAHVKGRPLSLVRYPDGVGGQSFFQ